MALTVEDGTGKDDADSYLSEADADTYVAAHGNSTDWSGASTSDKEEALRLATQYLDLKYGQRWKGLRANTDQALDWPRSGAEDRDGYAFDSDALPQALVDATAEMALRHITETDGIMPDQATSSSLESEKIKIGPIELNQKFAGAEPAGTKFVIVDRLITDLVESPTELRRA